MRRVDHSRTTQWKSKASRTVPGRIEPKRTVLAVEKRHYICQCFLFSLLTTQVIGSQGRTHTISTGLLSGQRLFFSSCARSRCEACVSAILRYAL